ncbi:MAG: hypothetical protein JRE28_11845 [Deltaproteobacteria bacterium]|nr:hypothetical protein [Deltaproteobacteria bacterium]
MLKNYKERMIWGTPHSKHPLFSTQRKKISSCTGGEDTQRYRFHPVAKAQVGTALELAKRP